MKDKCCSLLKGVLDVQIAGIGACLMCLGFCMIKVAYLDDVLKDVTIKTLLDLV